MGEVDVGVVGLGNMGSGIAACFARAGVPLGVWDANEAALGSYRSREGIRIMTPGNMAAAGATLFFVVPATPEIEACFDDDDGVLARAAPNLVVYDLTTSYPTDTKRLADRATERGINYLDAAMSGGAGGAAAGTLTLMIGGDSAAFERTREQLMIVGSRSALGRVAALLMDLSERAEHSCATVTIPLTRSEMGDYLGLTIETVSRSMSRLKALKIIALPRSDSVLILNRSRLSDLASGVDEGAARGRIME